MSKYPETTARLGKTFDCHKAETRIYHSWETAGAFRAGRVDGQAYTIVLPPPNVTGSLHMGHALNHTLQDILIRFERMRGRDVLWQPGMDHAGIATQMVVERQLDAEGISRHDLGREKFIERVWQWKEQSGDIIFNQMRRLGQSCDWSRSRFTMDDGFVRAVQKKFVDLHNAGLIYKAKRLVNWDPGLKTAISDLEVEQREVNGHYWHFKYPLEEEKGRFLTIATTRPETMLGDVAVAVHPDDPRYQDVIGKTLTLPLVGRPLPVVADVHADPEKGSGAVKITPAHDFDDNMVGKRHDLEMINILTDDARLNDNVPEKYRGMDRFDARKAIVADMDALELLEKVEEIVHMVPYGDRSGVVIEPYLTDQWYVDVEVMAKNALGAVQDGRTRFVPEGWQKTYFEWMRNIEPWCISRQLWWGHQIPAWYGPRVTEDGGLQMGTEEVSQGSIFDIEEPFVAMSAREAEILAEEKYGKEIIICNSYIDAREWYINNIDDHDASVPIYRDPDVLDTWFSSALWPFATLGWPDETDEVKKYYPTNLLVTGFDIIFFWVARMMMDGLHFRDEVPFPAVYVHALVRDEHGAKMSKSKGNVIDPLELADKFGADALRFTLAAMEAQGRDIKMSEKRVEGYRNFGTKLWNAARFCDMNGCFDRIDENFDPATVTLAVNQWIIGAVVKATAEVTRALEAFRYNEATAAIYHFTWGTFCDWYVELIKPLFYGEDDRARAETRAVAAWVMDRILKTLHPFMPFITEEIWGSLREGRKTQLIIADWPAQDESLIKEQAMAEINWVIQLISDIRTARAEMNVPAGAKLDMLVQGASPDTKKALESQGDVIRRLARLETIHILEGAPPTGAVQVVVGEATYFLPLSGVIDIAAEKARLGKSLDKLTKEIGGISGRLDNETFIARAPEKVVVENRKNLERAEQKAAKIREGLRRLETMD